MASIQNVVRQIVSKVIQEQRGGYGTKVREIIARLNEIPKNVSDDEARRLAVNIAESMDLQYLGSGIHRAVYAIDDDHVLKIGSPRANDVESDPKVQAILGPFATKVYYRGPYAVWVIAERVSPCKDLNKWWNHAGVANFELNSSGLDAHSYPTAISNPAMTKMSFWDEKDAEKFIMNIVNSDIGRRLLRIHNETNARVVDLHEDNAGYGSDGRPVILDLGHSKGFHAVKESKSLSESLGTKADYIVRYLRNVEKKAGGGEFEINAGIELAAKTLAKQGYLKSIGTSTRTVWGIVGEDLILKIAGDEEDVIKHGGILNQNQMESSTQLQQIMGPYMTRTFASGRRKRWIIVERVTPIRPSEIHSWVESVGLPSEIVVKHKVDIKSVMTALHDFRNEIDKVGMQRAIERLESELNYANIHIGYKEFLAIEENDLYTRLIRANVELGLDLDDLRWQNLGWADDGRPVILDLGLNEQWRELERED